MMQLTWATPSARIAAMAIDQARAPRTFGPLKGAARGSRHSSHVADACAHTAIRRASGPRPIERCMRAHQQYIRCPLWVLNSGDVFVSDSRIVVSRVAGKGGRERREIGRPSCGPPCGVLAFLQRIRTVSEHPNRNHSVGTLKLYVTLPDLWWEDPTRNALCSSYPLPAPVRTPSQTRAPITDSPAIVTNILVRVSVSRFGSFSLIPSRCSQHSLAPLALSLSRPTHLTGRRELWW